MADSKLDVAAIGNAIVDVISHADDAFLDSHKLTKGVMTLIDAAQAEALYDAMGPAIEMSGGSAANTVAGLASLGGRGAFIGKVRDDQLGRVFRHDIGAIGVRFETPAAEDAAPTARCLILVTPDAQRTMNTFLGACVELGPEDVDAAVITSAQVTYLEGYLWDPEGAKAAFRRAVDIAHGSGRKVALSLSDPFCVGRYRAEFRELVENSVDILFANEEELVSLYESPNFDDALQHVRGHCEVAALTRGAAGSVIVKGDDVHVIDPAPVAKVVDTTGAGDLYAAGFLFGLTQDLGLAECGRIAGIAAAEIIGHAGARPEVSLKSLI